MPPKAAPRAKKASKTTAATARTSVGNASELMPPPPLPASSPEKSTVSGETVATPISAPPIPDPMASKILGPEVGALRECLIVSPVLLTNTSKPSSHGRSLAKYHAHFMVCYFLGFWYSASPNSKSLLRCKETVSPLDAPTGNGYSLLLFRGAQRHAPYPPRHLVSSWSRNVERYNDILDSMEVQVVGRPVCSVYESLI
jgi:hypothetical protein